MSSISDSHHDIRVVSFDLDDTFWDCAPAIANAEHALYEWHCDNTPRIVAEHTPDTLLEFRKNIRKQHPELAGCVTAMRMQGLHSLLVKYGYPAALAKQAFDVFYRKRSQVVIYPGVIELLESLKGRFGLAAITNGNADLEYIGIAKYFDKIYGADLELKAKPHADMFHRCLDHFGVAGHQLLHIGDNPVTDVHGAIQAGARALWFNQYAELWQDVGSEPHFEARSIADIHRLFGG